MLHSTFLSSGTGFVNDGSYGLREFVKRRVSFRGLKWDSLVKLQNHGTVQGTGPGRAAVGTRFQSPTQMTWSSVAGRVPASSGSERHPSARPSRRSYPMIRRAGGVCKADAQELSDDRMA